MLVLLDAIFGSEFQCIIVRIIVSYDQILDAHLSLLIYINELNNWPTHMHATFYHKLSPRERGGEMKKCLIVNAHMFILSRDQKERRV